MAISERIKHVGTELKAHSPFTLFGAATGIAFMLLFKDISKENALRLFSVFHPLHVVLSAMVTAALFRQHRKISNFLVILLIGYVGSIGVATLSDSILPYAGQSILGAVIPTHAALHTLNEPDHVEPEADAHDEHLHDVPEAHTEHVHNEDCIHEHGHPGHLHLGFIEEWYLVNPAAILGVVLAYFWPRSHYPHALHILISTWASASFILMSSPEQMGFLFIAGMFIALFIAVWVPCCLSDIVFPTLFLRPDGVHLGHHGCVLCGRKEPVEKPESCNEHNH